MLVRECGDCAMCCKLLDVNSIEKKAGTWCTHCVGQRGCAIYETRPQECRNFICAWLAGPTLDERWKPSNCKFVVAPDGDGLRLKVAVDPARPDAWHKEPFYSYFKNWIRQNAADGAELLVLVGRRAIAVLPDSDVDLGPFTDDHRFIMARTETPFGPRFEPLKLYKDDPRARR
jgi:hypothetical protein